MSVLLTYGIAGFLKARLNYVGTVYLCMDKKLTYLCIYDMEKEV